jgi:peroxiredoxin
MPRRLVILLGALVATTGIAVAAMSRTPSAPSEPAPTSREVAPATPAPVGPRDTAAIEKAMKELDLIRPARQKVADDFTLKTADGPTVKLSEQRGKVVLVNFWATWCPPCKAEIPGFVELQEAYRDKGLQVVGVSVDDTPDKLKPFASEFKLNYPVLVGLERDDLQDAYGPMWGIPTTYLIARDGRICRKNSGIVGKAKYESDIKGLL